LDQICSNFYAKLYSQAQTTPEIVADRIAILSCVSNKFSPEMVNQLEAPFTKEELHKGMKQMARRRSLGLDEVTLDFFFQFWDLIGDDYTAMLQSSIALGRFPSGMTSGVITLLFKEGDRANLANWQPITLLNVSYKILTKTLQLQLQSILQEVISPEKSSFLPLRYILDNVLLQYETVQWAKDSDQDLIFLKLDFTKAYDTVSWDFLFSVMRKIGIHDSFTHIVRMLLLDASASILINGQISSSFAIQRGVCQGCPLSPYLFLLVGEAFNMDAKEDQRLGKMQGIQLPESEDRQLLSQYVDDNRVSILGQELFLKNTVDLIHCFGFALGLIINWTKSEGYWFANTLPPAWLNNFGISWAPPHSLSKLLGAPFGVSLETADVDSFLQLKITKKLKYWTTQCLSLAGRAIVVNAILFSSIYYFLAIWCGSIQAVRSARGSMRNFLWSGSEHLTQARVSWDDCCLPKLVGGLQLLDPEVSLNALLAKWVLYAIEPGIFGLKTLLRYRIHRMKPHPKTNFWFHLPHGLWSIDHLLPKVLEYGTKSQRR